jgi:hypothetical protein
MTELRMGTIRIPKTVESIGDYCFADCQSRHESSQIEMFAEKERLMERE